VEDPAGNGSYPAMIGGRSQRESSPQPWYGPVRSDWIDVAGLGAKGRFRRLEREPPNLVRSECDRYFAPVMQVVLEKVPDNPLPGD
jgi:hypothetical protein